MRGLKMICFSTLWVLTFSAIVTGKTTQEENNHLPIEIVFNPLKLKGSNSDVIKKENKEFQLKIQSDDANEGTVDLIIAATKKVQTSENTLDKISPENTTDQKNDKENSFSNRQGDNIYSKSLQTHQQNPGTIYQPTDFQISDPFASSQKTSELPQRYLFDRNPFSPLENLKHFEDNLQKEMRSPLLEQALGTLQYTNNESHLKMIASQPMYSNGYVPVFGMNSQYQPDQKYIHDMHPQNPRGYQDLRAPQQMQITPNVQMANYHLPMERPLVNSAVNPYYGYLNPVFKQSHPDPQLQFNIKEMARDPRYNAESGLISISPERQVPLHAPGQPEYNSQNPLMHKEQLPPRNIEVNHHNHYLTPQNQRVPEDHYNPHSNGHHQSKSEVDDRTLYYTPITENPRKYEQGDQNYPSSVNQHLHRLKIIPQEERNEAFSTQTTNKYPHLNRLQPQITQPPMAIQVPRYTIVPQHMLPKYLQTPVYRNIGEHPHSFEKQMQPQPLDNVKHFQEQHSLPARPYLLPPDHSRPKQKLPETYLNSIPPQPFSEVHRTHPQQEEYPKPSHYIQPTDPQRDFSQHSSQLHHEDPRKDQLAPTHNTNYPNHQKEYSVPSRYTKSREPDIDYSATPAHLKSQGPQQDYSANSHHLQSQEVLPEKYRTERGNNQMSTRKRRKKYRPVDSEHDNLPQTREVKKHRKSSLKDSHDDLHGHSSHQYIIKIG